MLREHRSAPPLCACGRPKRRRQEVCERCRAGVRTWRQVAEEYRRRSGERISDGAVKETALRAVRKLAIALRADREVCAVLGIEWMPLDE